MYNLRTNLIDAIFTGLKIDDNMFNKQIVRDKIEHIEDEQLQDFYGRLFDASHQYLNGLDRVAKVAEQFKPVETNHTKSKAEKLISGVETMNTVLWNEAKDLKRVFEDYVRMYEFENVCDETKAILNNVAPHYSIAELTINIRKYQTGVDAVDAFQRAIERTDKSSAVQIGNPIERLRINK